MTLLFNSSITQLRVGAPWGVSTLGSVFSG